jgi:cytidyltransferase-like protein
MIKTGIAQGRFHIVHHGHLEYLIEAKKLCEFLLVGVTDCDPERSYFNYSEIYENDRVAKKPFRSYDNPVFSFTYYERMMMLRLSMREAGIKGEEFEIVPFPIHKPYLLKYYIPYDSTIFLTIYDSWGEEKKNILERSGFNIQILWRRDLKDRFTTGTEVRRRLFAGEEWEHFVPESVGLFLKGIKEDL